MSVNQRLVERESVECAVCRDEIVFGSSAIGVEEGIIGDKGFQTFERRELVCSRECFRRFSDESDIIRFLPPNPRDA